MARQRSIFEEVSDTANPRPVAEAGGIARGSGGGGARRGIRLWLVGLFVLVVGMVLENGLARVSESALPVSDPRLLPGLAGLVWAMGFTGFLLARKIPTGWVMRLLVPGALIAAQWAVLWAVGWEVTAPAPAPTSAPDAPALNLAAYRLVLQLGLAFLLMGVLTWNILRLGRDEPALMKARRAREGRLFRVTTGLTHALVFQVLLGALVSAIGAGHSYAEWPLMGGQVFPPNAFDLEPVWRNFIENQGLVQFIHRFMGYLVAIFALVVWLRARRSPHAATRQAASLAVLLVLVQAGLGISTVLTGAQTHAALTHQVGAIVAFVLVLRTRFLAGYPAEQSVRG